VFVFTSLVQILETLLLTTHWLNRRCAGRKFRWWERTNACVYLVWLFCWLFVLVNCLYSNLMQFLLFQNLHFPLLFNFPVFFFPHIMQPLAPLLWGLFPPTPKNLIFSLSNSTWLESTFLLLLRINLSSDFHFIPLNLLVIWM